LELSPGIAPVNWNDIQYLYREQVNDTIRAAAHTMYELSARKTVQKDIRLPYFTTETDLAEIRRLTQKHQDSFWMALEREINNKSTTNNMKTSFDPETLLRIHSPINDRLVLKDGFIGRIAATLRGEAAAIATISKVRQVIVNGAKTNNAYNKRKTMMGFRTAAITKQKQLQTLQLQKEVREEEMRRLQKLLPPDLEEEMQFIWVTKEDEKICPQCLELESQLFPKDAAEIPHPGDGQIHPRCRCRLGEINVIVEGAVEDVGEYGDLESLLPF
jgi:hypothetical protein